MRKTWQTNKQQIGWIYYQNVLHIIPILVLNAKKKHSTYN